jgi:glutamine synthetase
MTTSKNWVNSNKDKIRAEYVWIGGNQTDLRSKGRILPGPVSCVEELPDWNYDGSSTGQSDGHNSDIIIKPRAIFRDPFRRECDILVMCDTYLSDGTPHASNTRAEALKTFEKGIELEPWFGIEQEYIMFNEKKRPLGFPLDGYPEPQGPYYCSVGAENAFGRDVVEEHFEKCVDAGVKICGINAEVFPGQWVSCYFHAANL